MSSTGEDGGPTTDPPPYCALESGEVTALSWVTPVGDFAVEHAAWGWDFCSAAPHVVFAVMPLGTDGDPSPPDTWLGVQLLVEGKRPDLFTGVWPAQVYLFDAANSTMESTAGTIELLEPFAGLDAPESPQTELHARVVAKEDGWDFVVEGHAVPNCPEYFNCTCPCG